MNCETDPFNLNRLMKYICLTFQVTILLLISFTKMIFVLIDWQYFCAV
jgi:hypothetical protein